MTMIKDDDVIITKRRRRGVVKSGGGGGVGVRGIRKKDLGQKKMKKLTQCVMTDYCLCFLSHR